MRILSSFVQINVLVLVKNWESIDDFEFFDDLLFEFVLVLYSIAGVDDVLKFAIVVNL